MKKNKTKNILWTILVIAYVIYAIIPLIKSFFTKVNKNTKNEEWVEVPLLA